MGYTTHTPGTAHTSGITNHPGAGVTSHPGAGVTNHPSAALVSPPGTPLLWFDAQNIDGTNNSSMIDGQQVGTWVNRGSLGAGANAVQATAGLRPLFRLVAASGKIGNKSSVQATLSTQVMQSAAFTLQTQPLTWAFVCMMPLGTGTVVLASGSNTNNNQTYFGVLALNLFAGTNFATPQSLTAGQWSTIYAKFNGASSFGTINGSSTGTADTGALGIDTVTLFNNPASNAAFNGHGVEFLCWGAGAPTQAQIDAYFAAKYGAFPQ